MEIRSAELGELRALTRMQLREMYPPQEADTIALQLFSHITGLSAAEMVIEKSRRLTESEMYFIQRSLMRLKRQEPLQYIIGSTNFFGYDFKVDPSVLIPRPETEELVDWILKNNKELNRQISILDIGTGSGCIAISLKKNLNNAEVYAVDISTEALKIAIDNATSLNADIDIEQLDILDEEACEFMPNFDIIVSNPPYVTPEDREKMQPNVVDYEPSLALFVEEDDPLLYYREVISFSHDHLNKGGSLYFECNESNANQVAGMLKTNGFKDVQVRKDMQGKDRMVLGVG